MEGIVNTNLRVPVSLQKRVEKAIAKGLAKNKTALFLAAIEEKLAAAGF